MNLEKTLEYLKIQESFRSENLTEFSLCKGIFLYVFLLPWKILYKHEVKQIIELTKTLWLFVKAFQRNVFSSMMMSMLAYSYFEHCEGSRRALRHLGT